ASDDRVAARPEERLRERLAAPTELPPPVHRRATLAAPPSRHKPSRRERRRPVTPVTLRPGGAVHLPAGGAGSTGRDPRARRATRRAYRAPCATYRDRARGRGGGCRPSGGRGCR